MRIGNQDYQFCLSSDDALDSGNRSVRLLSLLILSVVTAVTDLKLRHSVRSLTSPYNLVPSLTLKSPLFLMVICFSITPAFAWNGLNTTTVLSVSSNAVTVGTAVVFTATVTDQNASPVGHRAGGVLRRHGHLLRRHGGAGKGTVDFDRHRHQS